MYCLLNVSSCIISFYYGIYYVLLLSTQMFPSGGKSSTACCEGSSPLGHPETPVPWGRHSSGIWNLRAAEPTLPRGPGGLAGMMHSVLGVWRGGPGQSPIRSRWQAEAGGLQQCSYGWHCPRQAALLVAIAKLGPSVLLSILWALFR